ncbi:MAG: PPC domain-containing protein [Pirellulaceae bacterium]|nr:PPC domain-containing protein [Pirellulaceae bacterium]
MSIKLRRVLAFAAVGCAVVGVLGVTSSCKADDPNVSLISPPGLQRGTEVELLITGARIADAKEILFYEPGVEVTSLAAEGDNKVKVKLKATPDCQPGLHSMRLVTETGISNLRYFGVSPLPESNETEPNSDFATPQPATMNTTINGVVTNEDVDYYVVELAEGQKITCELEGIRLGTEMFDPFVAILDEKRFEVARSDDAPLLQQDCVCSMKAPRAGKYIIEVRESSFGGNERCQYRLHVGDFPRPLAVIPSGGRPGEKIEATVVDASGETWKESIQLPSTPGSFDFVSQHDGKVAPSGNRLRVIDLANTNEVEPDSDPATLVAVDSPAAFNGILQSNGDVDWFKIKGKKDQQLDFTVYGRRILRSPLDSWLEIHKVGGGRLAANDDAGGPDSVQTFKFPEDGEYLVAVRDQLNEGSPFHAYRIEVAPAEKSLELVFDELERYSPTLLEVPQGCRMAVLLRANRKNFGGDLGLRMENAPAGVELATPTVTANQPYIPMLVRATPDAPIHGSLTSLIGETLPDGAGVKGSFSQRTMLVRGQNNVDMWGHDSDRIAMAVTKAIPFDIEVVQPGVPLVANGSSTLVVKAKRKEGYKEQIGLRLLYAPGGVSASGSVAIPGDKDQVEIPITANGKPAFGQYPITVLARAKSVNANIWIASEFINLEVADSFFDYKFSKAVAELGSSSSISVGLTIKKPPEGETEFEIVGLPAGVTSPAPIVKLNGEMTQLDFPIQMGPDARAGQFKTLVIKATIKRPSGVIVQTQGTGELTLTPPAPAPVAVAAAPAPATPAPAAAPVAAPPKPLSRLEQLRQAQQALTKPAGQ